jgi:hypothetical protein
MLRMGSMDYGHGDHWCTMYVYTGVRQRLSDPAKMIIVYPQLTHFFYSVGTGNTI